MMEGRKDLWSLSDDTKLGATASTGRTFQNNFDKLDSLKKQDAIQFGKEKVFCGGETINFTITIAQMTHKT